MDPKKISVIDFTYTLPDERIAGFPQAERDASRLLIYRDGSIGEDIYRNIGHYLPENSLLIFNNTKVVEARIVFQKPTGGRIEIFCLEPGPGYPDITTAMTQTGSVSWKCLIGGVSKWKPGQVLTRTITRGSGETGPEIILEATWLEKLEDCFLVRLNWSPSGMSFAALLHEAGLIPLPPYIKRAVEGSDAERYQTVYALHDGSVAAPTAGLHFTDEILQGFAARNIKNLFVTLHIGAGTFKPVQHSVLDQHTMHAEFIAVHCSAIESLVAVFDSPHPAPVVPIGTTSLRTIESLYWLGVKTIRQPDIDPAELVVLQWDPYEMQQWEVTPVKSLASLLAWMKRQGLESLSTRTQLLIAPGYAWKMTSALVTNFHQPGSTLLLLVAALIGEDWRKVYGYALANGFRFLSYGDGCLLFRA